MAKEQEERRLCKKCSTMKKVSDFYMHRDRTPDDLCKDCLTMHVDNFNPEKTVTWILKRFDLPWIPGEWNRLRDREFLKNPNKMNGKTVFGKYIAKMRINQFNGLGWEDSEKYQLELEERAREEEAEMEKYKQELEEDLKSGKITEEEYKTLTTVSSRYKEEMQAIKDQEQAAIIAKVKEVQAQQASKTGGGGGGFHNMYDNPFEQPGGMGFIDENDLPDPAANLTKDEKLKLVMKWGQLYKPAQLLKLEQYYHDMSNSFDIQDADTRMTLKQLAKVYLKMDDALDIGDYDGYQKLSKSYDAMRKSSNFTAAQNKAEKDSYVDCVGNLVAQCEREGGFIPRFITDVPQDTIDLLLKDNNEFLSRLIKDDLGFSQEVDLILKKINAKLDRNEDPFNLDDDEPAELTDDDYAEHYASIEEQIERDMEEMGLE